MPRKRKPKLGLFGRIILAPLNATATALRVVNSVNRTFDKAIATERRERSSRRPWHKPRKPAKKKGLWG